MVKLTKIYTRGGDKGQTSLVSGARLSKADPLIEAYGAIDEANACVGLARLHTGGEADQMLSRIQNDLFDLGADLATPYAADEAPGNLRVAQAQIDRLETEIDSLNSNMAPLSSFILPGGSGAAANLHLARTVTRRAERRIVEAMATHTINPLALTYTNRLSDHLFVLGRAVNSWGAEDVLWVPGANRS